jgi:hypothetical protein
MHFPLTVSIPKYSTLPSQHTVRLPTDRSVQGSRQSVSLAIQRLFLLKIYCQQRSVYQRKRTNIRTTHWLFTFCVFSVGLGVLQAAVASLQSPDCDTEWLIGINVVCCRQQLLFYSHRTVILSG